MIQQPKSSNNNLNVNTGNGSEPPSNAKSAPKQRKSRANNAKQTKNDESGGPKTPTRAKNAQASQKSANNGDRNGNTKGSGNGKNHGNNQSKRSPPHHRDDAHGESADDKFSGSSFYLSPNAASLPRPPFAKPSSPEQRSYPVAHGPSSGAVPPMNNSSPPFMMPGPAPMFGQYPGQYPAQMPMAMPRPMYGMPTMPMMGPPMAMPGMPMNVPVMPVNNNQAHHTYG